MYQIKNYKFGEMTVNDTTYDNDLKIYPDKVKDNWWRDEGHYLQVQDLDEVFNMNINTLIVGKGAHGRMEVSDKVKQKAKENNIELIAQKTKKASEIFNKKSKENENIIVGAFHLTC